MEWIVESKMDENGMGVDPLCWIDICGAKGCGIDACFDGCIIDF